MNKNDIEKALVVAVLIAFLIPIVTSSVLDLEQAKRDEEAYRQFLVKEEERKIAEEKEYLLGKFDPALRGEFVLIPREYTTLSNPMYLRKETWEAFILMREAADKEGVDLKVASATRNFDYQKDIWEKKWTGVTLVAGEDLSLAIPDGFDRLKKISEYSAPPGTSRHHWGTDIDIYYAVPEYFEAGKGKKIYEWLTLNAGAFGFCQTYNAKGESRFSGYSEEKWHWSYLPLAKNFTERYKTLIRENDLGGFLGAEYLAGQNVINEYVLGINPDCL